MSNLKIFGEVSSRKLQRIMAGEDIEYTQMSAPPPALRPMTVEEVDAFYRKYEDLEEESDEDKYTVKKRRSSHNDPEPSKRSRSSESARKAKSVALKRIQKRIEKRVDTYRREDDEKKREKRRSRRAREKEIADKSQEYSKLVFVKPKEDDKTERKTVKRRKSNEIAKAEIKEEKKIAKRALKYGKPNKANAVRAEKKITAPLQNIARKKIKETSNALESAKRKNTEDRRNAEKELETLLEQSTKKDVELERLRLMMNAAKQTGEAKKREVAKAVFEREAAVRLEHEAKIKAVEDALVKKGEEAYILSRQQVKERDEIAKKYSELQAIVKEDNENFRKNKIIQDQNLIETAQRMAAGVMQSMEASKNKVASAMDRLGNKLDRTTGKTKIIKNLVEEKIEAIRKAAYDDYDEDDLEFYDAVEPVKIEPIVQDIVVDATGQYTAEEMMAKEVKIKQEKKEEEEEIKEINTMAVIPFVKKQEELEEKETEKEKEREISEMSVVPFMKKPSSSRKHIGKSQRRTFDNDDLVRKTTTEYAAFADAFSSRKTRGARRRFPVIPGLAKKKPLLLQDTPYRAVEQDELFLENVLPEDVPMAPPVPPIGIEHMMVEPKKRERSFDVLPPIAKRGPKIIAPRPKKLVPVPEVGGGDLPPPPRTGTVIQKPRPIPFEKMDISDDLPEIKRINKKQTDQTMFDPLVEPIVPKKRGGRPLPTPVVERVRDIDMREELTIDPFDREMTPTQLARTQKEYDARIAREEAAAVRERQVLFKRLQEEEKRNEREAARLLKQEENNARKQATEDKKRLALEEKEEKKIISKKEVEMPKEQVRDRELIKQNNEAIAAEKKEKARLELSRRAEEKIRQTLERQMSKESEQAAIALQKEQEREAKKRLSQEKKDERAAEIQERKDNRERGREKRKKVKHGDAPWIQWIEDPGLFNEVPESISGIRNPKIKKTSSEDSDSDTMERGRGEIPGPKGFMEEKFPFDYIFKPKLPPAAEEYRTQEYPGGPDEDDELIQGIGALPKKIKKIKDAPGHTGMQKFGKGFLDIIASGVDAVGSAAGVKPASDLMSGFTRFMGNQIIDDDELFEERLIDENEPQYGSIKRTPKIRRASKEQQAALREEGYQGSALSPDSSMSMAMLMNAMQTKQTLGQGQGATAGGSSAETGEININVNPNISNKQKSNSTKKKSSRVKKARKMKKRVGKKKKSKTVKRLKKGGASKKTKNNH